MIRVYLDWNVMFQLKLGLLEEQWKVLSNMSIPNYIYVIMLAFCSHQFC